MNLRLLLIIVFGLLLTACQRGPDPSLLQEQIQSLLDTEFKPGLFEVSSIKRSGSVPTTDKSTGDERLIVYYNARLTFLKDYKLSSWDTLGISTLSFLMGATDKGISGFQSAGNKKGETLDVFGTAHYALRSGVWQPVSMVTNGDSKGTTQSESTKVKKLLGSLNETYETNSGRLGGKEIKILDKELTAATRKINRQLDVLENVYSIASGPKGGNYYEITQFLDRYLRYKTVKTNSYATQGSVENVKLIQSNAIDMAMSQNNVAAMAYKGEGLFKEDGPMVDLRAVASLFPEVIHVVVPKDSDILTLGDLKGKRIDLGLPNSGSRLDALNILNAVGLKLSDFSVVSETGLKPSVNALKVGELDAFFTTIESPSLTIQQLVASYPVRFLPIDAALIDQSPKQLADYIPITIPAYTYPQQRKTITTLGVSALMLANQHLPDQKVWDFLDAIMMSLDDLAEENIKATFLSRQDAQTGITIPMHPGAQAYFE